MKTAMEPYVRSLLDVMLSSGLSPTLVEALEQISDRYGVPFNNLNFLTKNFLQKWLGA